MGGFLGQGLSFSFLTLYFLCLDASLLKKIVSFLGGSFCIKAFFFGDGIGFGFNSLAFSLSKIGSFLGDTLSLDAFGLSFLTFEASYGFIEFLLLKLYVLYKRFKCLFCLELFFLSSLFFFKVLIHSFDCSL